MKVKIFLDCGLIGDINSIINPSVALSLELKVNNIRRVNITLGDNSTSLKVIGKTTIKVQIGSHVEISNAIVAEINEFMILGLNWLTKHNPTIDWTKKFITFGDNCVAEKHCSQPVTVSTAEENLLGYKNFGVKFVDDVSDAVALFPVADKVVDGVSKTVTLSPVPNEVGFSKENVVGSLEVTLSPSGNRMIKIDSDQSGSHSPMDVTSSQFQSNEGYTSEYNGLEGIYSTVY